MKGNQSKIIIILFVTTLLAFAATGCGSGDQEPGGQATVNSAEMEGAGFPVTITDSLDREVVVEREPQKIVSLSPAITEILFAIEADEKIVGVTDYCDYPAEALEKPKVGGFEKPNLELIVSSQPDLIFTAAGIQEDFIKEFENLGMKVIALDASTLEQVLENIELAGRVTGTVREAASTVKTLEQRIEAIRVKIERADTKPDVFFEVWDDPLMTAGPGSFIDNLITLAGGKNIAGDINERFAEFNREVLLSRNPDIYIINSHAHTPQDIKNRPGFDRLQAVLENRVYAIEDDLVTLPGPRLVDGLEEMAKIIHPELF